MKVSVIIPLYNAEKYLSVCLESLLIQTCADFEVIIVDDCSTDNSCAVAESYLEKFGGRLKIVSLPQNTGSGAVPRNEGLKFSRGEYISFVDADDFIIDTALETLYNSAEKYKADFVYMEQGFIFDEEKTLTGVSWTPPEFVLNKVTMESGDVSKRLDMLLSKGYGLTPWTKFLRRDFLIANKIVFPRLKISEDVLWTFKIVCRAENFLRIPNQLYVYRSLENSQSRSKRQSEGEINFWLNPIANGFDYLDELTSSLEFFKKNPAYCFRLFKFFEMWNFQRMKKALKNFEPHELCEIFMRELSESKNISPALTAYLLTMTSIYRNELIK